MNDAVHLKSCNLSDLDQRWKVFLFKMSARVFFVSSFVLIVFCFVIAEHTCSGWRNDRSKFMIVLTVFI